MAVVEELEDDEPEDERAETPAAVLAEDLQRLESAYQSWHASLEQIWVLEHDGPLDERTFSRARWLEYQMTSNLQQQERLRRRWSRPGSGKLCVTRSSSMTRDRGGAEQG